MMRSMFILILAALGAPAALAEDDPSGIWEFRTEIADKGCAISGVMTIDPLVPGESVRNCQFVSAETCGPDDPEPTSMEQSCRIIQQGEFYLIRSKVNQSRTPGRGIEYYMADNFTIRSTSASTMDGTWYDEMFADHVKFWRSRGGASS